MKQKRMLMITMVFLIVLSAGLWSGGTQETASTTAGGSVFNPTGLPVVKEPVTFKVIAYKDVKHGAYAEMGVFQQLEQETGIIVDWVEVPQSNFNEKKNLILASNDLPDIFMHGINSSDQLLYGPQGVFIPLEGLVDQYAPNLKKIFSDRPEIESYVTTPDGHMYVLPRIQELSHRVTPDNMFINKTWLDKLGLAVPATTEEYYQVLKAFRDGDPNGNGKNDELPLSFWYSGGSEGIWSLFGSFGILDVQGSHVVVENGKVVFSPVRDEYKDGLLWIQKLYVEGLIDPEVFTHDRMQYLAKGKEADTLYGSFFSWFDENVAGIERAENDYVVLPPLKGPAGHQLWNYSPYNVLARDNFAVTSECELPEAAIRWANEMYSPDKSFQLCYGTWGITIERKGDKVLFMPTPEGVGQDEFRYKHSPAYTTPFFLSAADFNSIDLSSNHVRKIERLEVYRPFFPPLEDIYPPVYFTAEEEEELAVLRTDLDNYVSQMTARWIVGELEIEKNWADYLGKLGKMGLDRYLEIYQAALDR